MLGGKGGGPNASWEAQVLDKWEPGPEHAGTCVGEEQIQCILGVGDQAQCMGKVIMGKGEARPRACWDMG